MVMFLASASKSTFSHLILLSFSNSPPNSSVDLFSTGFPAFSFLIHSAAPQSLQKVITIFTHADRPSAQISKSLKTKQFSSKNSDRYWWDCGSGRVDHYDTCLVSSCVRKIRFYFVFLVWFEILHCHPNLLQFNIQVAWRWWDCNVNFRLE